ncbi:hypothetical protein P4O66_012230 [Electrophorus voltai]|uniref:MIR domain-containing protein n=1 Tax=Electrophorus voltai TaxID=2609070 RepID=A0AAD8Z477_9TELE|nr:hypothetical protein P4O66_012230 [Electrophorus voltai]
MSDGSGQQSVTGVDAADDANSYWRIRGKPNETCQRGLPVKCGQAVRFTHMKTGRNLHTHHFSSPLSNNQEVSAFGENGEGDDLDVWMVQCSGTYWERDDTVRFKHAGTSVFLSVTGEQLLKNRRFLNIKAVLNDDEAAETEAEPFTLMALLNSSEQRIRTQTRDISVVVNSNCLTISSSVDCTSTHDTLIRRGRQILPSDITKNLNFHLSGKDDNNGTMEFVFTTITFEHARSNHTSA